MLAYKRTFGGGKFPLRTNGFSPILADFDGQAGVVSGHYFHQDLWAARKIFGARPLCHVDVGSRIDGFVAHLLTFMPVTVVDVRPLIKTHAAGLTFIQEDGTYMPSFADNSVESLSSLHAVEHFGLGRFGDPIGPDRWSEAMWTFTRVLKPGGRLYFAVPIGVERLEFNAHRVFAPQTVIDGFRKLKLISFAAVDDAGDFRVGVQPDDFDSAIYSCGLFEFTK